MCGIAGFLGDFDPSLLQKMGEALRTRGPDNIGTWYQGFGSVGLVHTRLSIIDLSESSNQPMQSACGRLVIVFNGEIYNYRELKKTLFNSGYQFRTSGDTEVIINMYLEYGISCLKRLKGIFALAIYDSKLGQTFVARDGQGIKPLYYSSTPSGFIFASELKALLQEGSVSREINPDAVAEYLTFLWAPTPSTMLKNVKKLEQGSYLSISRDGVISQYEFYDYPDSTRSSNLSATEAIEETRRRLEKAVSAQLVSDVPVGAFLSGGLDSSAVVALAKQVEPDLDLPCFTIEFAGDNFRREGSTEDLPYAKQVASHLGLPLHQVKVDPAMILDLEKMIFHLDEPQADLAPLNAMYICELARSQGVKVLLSGAGGDDIFLDIGAIMRYRKSATGVDYLLRSDDYFGFPRLNYRSEHRN